MDPRHPELAMPRVKELIAQYDRVEQDIKRATVSARLAELEREGMLVTQELFLVVPRLHEALMQTSRQRRHDLARGVLVEPQDTAVESPVKKPVEKSEPTEEKEVISKKETTTKKTTKKKTTKKAKK